MFGRFASASTQLLSVKLPGQPWRERSGSGLRRAAAAHRWLHQGDSNRAATATLRTDSPCLPLKRREAPREVGLEIGNVFQAHRYADQAIANTGIRAVFWRKATVGGRAGMGDGALAIA